MPDMDLSLRVGVKGTERFSRNMRGVRQDITRTGRTAGGAGGAISSGLGGLAATAAVAGGVALAVGAVGSTFKTATDEFISYESALADVRKPTGFTVEETAKLGDDLIEMSKRIPLAAEELATIAATAGQLGLGGEGADAIVEFTEVVAKFAAVTDLTAAEAATSFAQVSNVMKLPIENAEALGSVFNELSNSSTATARDLVDLSLRMGGAAEQFGLSIEDVAAISATLRDMGVSAEVGGTAVSQILTKAFLETEEFAKIIGVSEDAFKDLLATDPRAAFTQILDGLAGLDDFAKAKAIQDLGIEGQRGLGVLLKLAGATETLTGHMALADDAFEEGISLQKEFAIMSGTTANQLQLVKNQAAAARIAVGEGFAPVLLQMQRAMLPLTTVALPVFADRLMDIMSLMPSMGGAMGDLGQAFGDVFNDNKTLSESLSDLRGNLSDMSDEEVREMSDAIIDLGVDIAEVSALATAAFGMVTIEFVPTFGGRLAAFASSPEFRAELADLGIISLDAALNVLDVAAEEVVPLIPSGDDGEDVTAITKTVVDEQITEDESFSRRVADRVSDRPIAKGVYEILEGEVEAGRIDAEDISPTSMTVKGGLTLLGATTVATGSAVSSTLGLSDDPDAAQTIDSARFAAYMASQSAVDTGLSPVTPPPAAAPTSSVINTTTTNNTGMSPEETRRLVQLMQSQQQTPPPTPTTVSTFDVETGQVN